MQPLLEVCGYILRIRIMNPRVWLVCHIWYFWSWVSCFVIFATICFVCGLNFFGRFLLSSLPVFLFWIEKMCCLLRKPNLCPHFVPRCGKERARWQKQLKARRGIPLKIPLARKFPRRRQRAKLCTSWGNFGERFIRCGSKESQHKHGGCVEETCNTSFCLDCLLHRESRLELHCRSAGRGGAAVAGPVRPMLTFPDKFHHAPPVPVHLPPPIVRSTGTPLSWDLSKY